MVLMVVSGNARAQPNMSETVTLDRFSAGRAAHVGVGAASCEVPVVFTEVQHPAGMLHLDFMQPATKFPPASAPEREQAPWPVDISLRDARRDVMAEENGYRSRWKLGRWMSS